METSNNSATVCNQPEQSFINPINPKPYPFSEEFLEITASSAFNEARLRGEFSFIDIRRLERINFKVDTYNLKIKKLTLNENDTIIIDKAEPIKPGDVVAVFYRFGVRIRNINDFSIGVFNRITKDNIHILANGKEHQIPLKDILRLNKVIKVLKLVKV